MKYPITHDESKFYLLEDDKEFTFKPMSGIDLGIKYPFGEKVIAQIKITYTITDLTDTEKPRLISSIQNIFTITKDDKLPLEPKGELVFECVKTLERLFNEHLQAKRSYLNLAFFNVKLLTLQDWKDYKPAPKKFSAN